MKIKSFLLAAGAALIVGCAGTQSNVAPTGSDWDLFTKTMDNYYHIDTQDLRQLTCRVESPPMITGIKNLKEQVAGLGDQITITENIAEFGFTITKTGGLAINKPSFNIGLSAADKGPVPEELTKTLATINNQVTSQISGMENILKGILEQYIFPTRERFKIKSATTEGNKRIFEYINDKTEIRGVYSGNTVVQDEKSASGSGVSTLNYTAMPNGLLLLENAATKGTDPNGNLIAAEIDVDYQDVSGVTVPQKIILKVVQTIGDRSQEGGFMYVVKDCAKK